MFCCIISTLCSNRALSACVDEGAVVSAGSPGGDFYVVESGEFRDSTTPKDEKLVERGT